MVGALSAGDRATAPFSALHGDSPQAHLGRLAEDGARDLVGEGRYGSRAIVCQDGMGSKLVSRRSRHSEMRLSMSVG